MGDIVPNIVSEYMTDHTYTKPKIGVSSATTLPRFDWAVYLANNPVFTSPAELVINCTACEHVFHNVHYTDLDKHLSTNKHIVNSQWSPDEVISKSKYLLATNLLKSHNFLVRSTKTTVTCTLCDSVFTESQFDKISYHIRTKHSHTLPHKSVRRPLAPIDTNVFVQREIARHPGTFAESQSSLFCTYCHLKFCPKDPANLYHCASKHVRSKSHRDSVNSKIAEQSVQEPDGFISPPVLPKPKPHTRSISTEEKVQSTKLMLWTNTPWDAAKSYGSALQVGSLGRTVSPNVSSKEGLRLVYEGKFGLFITQLIL